MSDIRIEGNRVIQKYNGVTKSIRITKSGEPVEIRQSHDAAPWNPDKVIFIPFDLYLASVRMFGGEDA